MLINSQNRPLFLYNKNLNDYCKKSTSESIKRLTEKFTLERKKVKINNPLEDDDSDKPNINFWGFFIILSISTFGMYFYKRIK